MISAPIPPEQMDANQQLSDATRAEVKDEISGLEDRLGDLRTRRANVEEQLEAARANVEDATEGVAAAPGEEEPLGTAIDQRAKRDALSDALDRLDGQIGDVETRLRAARQRLANIDQTERLLRIIGEGAEAHEDLRDALRAAVDAVIDHLDTAADARERLDEAGEAFNQEAGGTSEARIEAARTVKGEEESDAHRRAVSLLLSNGEARAAGLPRPESAFPIKAGETGHPADTAVLVKALRSSLHTLLNERSDT